jgi:hypothetical protein
LLAALRAQEGDPEARRGADNPAMPRTARAALGARFWRLNLSRAPVAIEFPDRITRQPLSSVFAGHSLALTPESGVQLRIRQPQVVLSGKRV